MSPTARNPQELPHSLYLGLQKILRTLDFSKSLQGKELPLSMSQMRVLSFFNEQDVVHVSEISRDLGLSIQNVNNIVRRLEDAGYVTRTPNKENRRFSDVRQTAKGKKRLVAFRKKQLETLTRFLGRLNDNEQSELTAAIRRVAGILEKASRLPEKAKGGRAA